MKARVPRSSAGRCRLAALIFLLHLTPFQTILVSPTYGRLIFNKIRNASRLLIFGPIIFPDRPQGAERSQPRRRVTNIASKSRLSRN